MVLETKREITQFVELHKKSDAELRAICEGLSLDYVGRKETLIQQIIQKNFSKQTSVILPQTIPLRTLDDSGIQITAAIEAIKGWRKSIFEAKNNRKIFFLLNSKGKEYSLPMRYIRCSDKLVSQVMQLGWYLPVESQSDLIRLLKKDPSKFSVCIVQKPSKRGNSFIMLHAEPKNIDNVGSNK